MVDIKLCASPDDLRGAVTPIWHYFGRQPLDEQVQALQRVMPALRVHTAWDDIYRSPQYRSGKEPISFKPRCSAATFCAIMV
jgi:hypothetical protein